jgi:hypothetical protein
MRDLNAVSSQDVSQHSTVQCNTAQHNNTAQHTQQYSTAQHTQQYSTTHTTIQHSTAQHHDTERITTQHNTTLYSCFEINLITHRHEWFCHLSDSWYHRGFDFPVSLVNGTALSLKLRLCVHKNKNFVQRGRFGNLDYVANILISKEKF